MYLVIIVFFKDGNQIHDFGLGQREDRTRKGSRVRNVKKGQRTRRREEGSGWGTHVYLWRIHFDIWQN